MSAYVLVTAFLYVSLCLLMSASIDVSHAESIASLLSICVHVMLRNNLLTV